MSLSKKSPLRSLLLALIAIGFTSQQSHAQNIEWQIAPYMWATGVNLDVTVNREPVLGEEALFKDLLDKIDSAFMGHLEAHGEHFGVFGDSFAVSLGDSTTTSLAPGGPILDNILLDTSLEVKLYELGGFYRIGDQTSAFDFLAGARVVDLKQNLLITLPGLNDTEINRGQNVSETDMFFGMRAIGQISGNWDYKARVDMSTGGGTDGTLNLLAAVGYNFGENDLFSIDVGYRYFSVDLVSDKVNSLRKTEIELSGPIVGFIFNF